MSMLTLCLLLLATLLIVAPVSSLSPRELTDAVYKESRRSPSTTTTTAAPPSSRPPPSGYTNIHDPSGVVWEESSQAWYVFGTGITSHVSTDGYNWKQGVVPLQTSPAWVKTYVPLHMGGMWAPDVVYLNGLWHMYYAVSTWSGPVSCIGVATTPSLGSPNWTDSGAPVVCDIWSWTGLPMSKVTINAIDPHLFIDPRTNRRYLNYGSFHAGVYVIELTGDPVVSTQIGERVNVQRRIGNFDEGAEGSWVQVSPSGAFWLFGNWGTCCVGVNSTYNIRIGTSVNPLGPYYDRDGLDMRFNGGTLLLNVSANQVGPGQIGFPSAGPVGSPGGNISAPVISYHYYDRNSNPPGSPTLGQASFLWDVNGWPAVVERM